MDKIQFQEWASKVRATLRRKIHEYVCYTGEYPEAIIAGGEYAYAIMDDRREFSHSVDGRDLWSGIPFLRCGAIPKVKIITKMVDVDLPDVPKGDNIDGKST